MDNKQEIESNESSQDYESSRYEGLIADSSTLNLLLETATIMMVLKNSLLGNEFNPQKERWERKIAPLMDEEGIHRIMHLLTSCIGIPQQLSNLDKGEMKNLLKEVLDTTNDFIFFHSDQYGLEESNFSTVFSIVEVNMSTFLSKTRGGFTMKSISKLYGVKEQVSSNQRSGMYEHPKQASGGLSFWPRR